MGGSIVFYTYGSTLELYGQQFTAGMLTADLLNLSPDEYRPMSKRMKQVTSLAEEYEQSGSIELWWKLNEELAALCGVLRRYAVFRLLLDESEDAFFSVIREITGQFDLFPKEEHEPSEEIQRKRLERVANETSARSETVKDAPLDLFHPSEAALEKGDAFYYEMLRASVLPRTHGVITKSTSAVMKHIFTTFALSTVLFGISSALVCPS